MGLRSRDGNSDLARRNVASEVTGVAGKAGKAAGSGTAGTAALRKVVRAAASTAKKTAAAVAKASKGASRGAKGAKAAAAEATESAVKSGSEVHAATPGDVDPDEKQGAGLEYWQWVGEFALQMASGIPDSVDWAPGANKLYQFGYGWMLMNCEVSGPLITAVHEPTVKLWGLVNCGHPSSGAGDREMGSDADCAALAAGSLPPRLVPKNGGSTSFPCGGADGNRDLPWGEVWPAQIAVR